MNGSLVQLLTTTPPQPIDDAWGESDAIVYILLGIGLILTIAVAAIFIFILARSDRED